MSNECPFCNSSFIQTRSAMHYDVSIACNVCKLRTCPDCSRGGLCLYHFEMLSEKNQRKIKNINGAFKAIPILFVIPVIILATILSVGFIVNFISRMDQSNLYISIIWLMIIVILYLSFIFTFPILILFKPAPKIARFWIINIWKKETGKDPDQITDVLKEISNTDFIEVIKQLKKQRRTSS